MRAIRLVFIACLGLLVSCTSTTLQNSPYILNKKLLVSYDNFDISFKKPRGSLLYAGGRTADNYQKYFDLDSKYEMNETIHNQSVKSEYIICDALKILSNSSSEHNKTLDFSDLGKELLSKLDLRSFPSSLYRASNENSHTLESLYPEYTSSDGNVAELNTKDWALTLEVVAVAKINDNSYLDWVVWVLDESKSGNYRGYSTLIVYDPENQESYKAIAYP